MKKYLALLWHIPHAWQNAVSINQRGYVNWDSWREWIPGFEGTPPEQGDCLRFMANLEYGSLNTMNVEECTGEFVSAEEITLKHLKEWGTMIGMILWIVDQQGIEAESLRKGGLPYVEELYGYAMALRHQGEPAVSPSGPQPLVYGDKVAEEAKAYLSELCAGNSRWRRLWQVLNGLSYAAHTDRHKPRVVDVAPLDKRCYRLAYDIFLESTEWAILHEERLQGQKSMDTRKPILSPQELAREFLQGWGDLGPSLPHGEAKADAPRSRTPYHIEIHLSDE